MAYDWLTASADARAELYRACKRVVDGHYVGDWEKFFAFALEGRGAVSDGYVDNFRKGLISRSKAAQMARWLSVHHTREAELLARNLAQLERSEPLIWETLIRGHAIAGHLAIVPFASLAIVGLASKAGHGLTRLRLGEEFCLRLRPTLCGHAIAFQKVGELWYALPLADDRPDTVIDDGELLLPRSSLTREPLPLSDAEDGGVITFIVIVAARRVAEVVMPHDGTVGAIPAKAMNAIAEEVLSEGVFEIHRAEVLIN